MVREIKTKAEFDAALKDAGSKLVIIDFFATWCGPCVAIAPKVDAMSTNEFPDTCVFLKIDVDKKEMGEVCKQYDIKCMPTFVFIKAGKTLDDRLEGASEEDLRKLIQKHSK